VTKERVAFTRVAQKRFGASEKTGWQGNCMGYGRTGKGVNMDLVLTTGGQIIGCTIFALLLVRGIVGIANDFTDWTLRRNGIDPDQ
jgi:hypothetical protein